MIATLGRIAVFGIILGGAWALGSGGCVREVQDHCANLSGDWSCRGYFDKTPTPRNFCNSCESAFHGCTLEPPQDDACWHKGTKPSEPPVDDDTGSATGSDTGDGASTSDSGGDDLPVVTGDGSGDGSGSGSGGPAAECGNGILEEGEDCDGEDLGDADCSMFGKDMGMLVCRDDCLFDPSQCESFMGCNDGVIEPPEECEDGMLDGQSCATLEDDRTGGNLSCANCLFNTTGCCIPNGQACASPEDCCSGICTGLGPLLPTCKAPA